MTFKRIAAMSILIFILPLIYSVTQRYSQYHEDHHLQDLYDEAQKKVEKQFGDSSNNEYLIQAEIRRTLRVEKMIELQNKMKALNVNQLWESEANIVVENAMVDVKNLNKICSDLVKNNENISSCELAQLVTAFLVMEDFSQVVQIDYKGINTKSPKLVDLFNEMYDKNIMSGLTDILLTKLEQTNKLDVFLCDAYLSLLDYHTKKQTRYDLSPYFDQIYSYLINYVNTNQVELLAYAGGVLQKTTMCEGVPLKEADKEMSSFYADNAVSNVLNSSNLKTGSPFWIENKQLKFSSQAWILYGLSVYQDNFGGIEMPFTEYEADASIDAFIEGKASEAEADKIYQHSYWLYRPTDKQKKEQPAQLQDIALASVASKRIGSSRAMLTCLESIQLDYTKDGKLISLPDNFEESQENLEVSVFFAYINYLFYLEEYQIAA